MAKEKQTKAINDVLHQTMCSRCKDFLKGMVSLTTRSDFTCLSVLTVECVMYVVLHNNTTNGNGTSARAAITSVPSSRSESSVHQAIRR